MNIIQYRKYNEITKNALRKQKTEHCYKIDKCVTLLHNRGRKNKRRRLQGYICTVKGKQVTELLQQSQPWLSANLITSLRFQRLWRLSVSSQSYPTDSGMANQEQSFWTTPPISFGRCHWWLHRRLSSGAALRLLWRVSLRLKNWRKQLFSLYIRP